MSALQAELLPIQSPVRCGEHFRASFRRAEARRLLGGPIVPWLQAMHF